MFRSKGFPVRILWLLLAAASGSASAAERLAEIPLVGDGRRTAALSGTALEGEVLRIEADSEATMLPVIALDDPGISRPVYALTGEIRHEGVDGTGYLQMDNDFGELGVFFTKSLATDGPLAHIRGSGDWRGFVLPFFATADGETVAEAPVPKRISLSLYLPDGGTVYLRGLELYQYAAGENPLMAGMWFGPATAATVGAVGGTLVGFWGAIVGFLVSRGRARGFVLGSSMLLVAAGAAALIGGMLALGKSQPYAVYFPLLLGGVILLGVVLPLRGTLVRRYEAFEIGKMQSMDIGAGQGHS